MSTGLFADEEDGYDNLEQNLGETKYVLKGSAPSTDSSVDAIEEPIEEPMDDLDGLEDAPADDKPFDDEPFDAGVEADEDTDPEKYIQQLSGKLGQSLRQYSEDQGQPDFDLEKFAVNSVLSATHTGEMDKEDQRDIINKVKGSGNDEGGNDDDDVDIDIDKDVDVGGDEPVDEGDSHFGNDENFGTEKSRFGKDDQWESYFPKENKLEVKNENENPCWAGYRQLGMKMKDGKEVPNCVPINETITEADYQGKTVKLNKPMKGDVKKFKVFVKNDKGNVVKVNFGDKNMEIKRDDPEARKSFRARHNCDEKTDKTTAGYWSCKMWSSKSVTDILEESEKSGNFVDKTNIIEKLRLMENAEPMVEPKPITKPITRPARPMRETDRPFAPRPRKSPDVQPDPKADMDNDLIIDNE